MLWGVCLAAGVRKVRAMRAHRKTIENTRKARRITLLREWLSPEQQAQFDIPSGQ
jgi:hypothetical protein